MTRWLPIARFLDEDRDGPIFLLRRDGGDVRGHADALALTAARQERISPRRG